MSEKAFFDFICAQTPNFDALILKDIRPMDSWVSCITGDVPKKEIPRWWITREEVRKLSEGLAFQNSEKEFDKPLEDQFRDVFPGVIGKWNGVKSFPAVGKRTNVGKRWLPSAYL